jgi:V/A-type H+-transporting ATPase subunit I
MLPEEYAYLSTDDALVHIQKKIEINHNELDEIDKRFNRMAVIWLSKLQTWRLVCEDLHDEHDAYLKIGETEFTFTIFGWVPAENLKSLESVLQKSFGDQVVLNVIDVPKELKKKIPVAMRNPEPMESFENLVKMRAIPSYTDIDPSPLVAIFMPLFFGMMIGDVGYGLIMFLLAIILLRKPRAGLLGDVLKALQFGALWSIFFGILFGEYFGTLGEALGLYPLWFSRTESSSITSLIFMSITVGTIHILLGLAIGVWNSFKHHNRHEAFEKVGMILGLLGLIIAAGSMAAQLPYALIGWIIMGIGIVTLAISLGKIGFFLGPIEFIGVIGSILSYLRIAALGLASVFLAKVANDMAGMVGSIIVGVIIAGLIHVLNIIIGILSPTIQSLRLQYVEFFRRFYEGGQMAFSPFCRRVPAQVRTKISRTWK